MIKHKKRSKKLIGSAKPKLTGPIDSLNHDFSDHATIRSHIKNMQNEKEKFQTERQELLKKYEEDKIQMQKEKEKNEANAIRISDRNHERRLQSDRANNEANIAATQALMGTTAYLTSGTASVINSTWDKVTGLSNGAMNSFHAIAKGTGNTVNSVGSGASKVMITVAMWISVVLLALCWFIFAILFVLLVIYIIWYLISGALPSSSQSSSSKKCKKATEIDIANFGSMFSTNMVGDSLSTSKKDISGNIRPYYNKIPKVSFDIYNMSKTLNEMGSYMFYWVSFYSSPIQSQFKKVTDSKQLNVYQEERKELKSGRSDNIVSIDAGLIDNKKMLHNKKIVFGGNNSVINIARPSDITWSLPDEIYTDKDISKLPPSLLKMRQKNGISLEEKKEIVIPWRNENNTYVLSCEDAYFKNNPSEKADIFIDSDDGKTCSVNIGSASKSFSETKKRYVKSNDLGRFL